MKEEREKEVIILPHLVSNICTSIWIWHKFYVAVASVVSFIWHTVRKKCLCLQYWNLGKLFNLQLLLGKLFISHSLPKVCEERTTTLHRILFIPQLLLFLNKNKNYDILIFFCITIKLSYSHDKDFYGKWNWSVHARV